VAVVRRVLDLIRAARRHTTPAQVILTLARRLLQIAAAAVVRAIKFYCPVVRNGIGN
jgi:hypothetical protein